MLLDCEELVAVIEVLPRAGGFSRPLRDLFTTVWSPLRYPFVRYKLMMHPVIWRVHVWSYVTSFGSQLRAPMVAGGLNMQEKITRCLRWPAD